MSILNVFFILVGIIGLGYGLGHELRFIQKIGFLLFGSAIIYFLGSIETSLREIKKKKDQ
jgi:hypothetical protein